MKVREVAELLEVTPQTVRRWVSKGKIPCYVLHMSTKNTYIFNRDEIDALTHNVQILEENVAYEIDFEALERQHAKNKNEQEK